MRWHYRLDHLTFKKLKQLALNGEIPKKLALLNPPECAECLFGAMTKIPWRGKEPKSLLHASACWPAVRHSEYRSTSQQSDGVGGWDIKAGAV